MTKQPVADATVRIEGLGFYLPFAPFWQLTHGQQEVGETDAAGRVSIESMSFPASVYIVSGRHLPWRFDVSEPPEKGGWSPWRSDDNRALHDDALIEVRIGP